MLQIMKGNERIKKTEQEFDFTPHLSYLSVVSLLARGEQSFPMQIIISSALIEAENGLKNDRSQRGFGL